MTQDKRRTDHATIERRREMVARLVVRRLSVREITEALAREGIRNPISEAPWGKSTIHDDVKALEADWQRRYQHAIDQHKAKQLADLEEVIRQAWQAKDLSAVLAALSQKATLLGLNKPSKVDISVYVRERAEALGLDPEAAVREAERLVRAAG